MFLQLISNPAFIPALQRALKPPKAFSESQRRCVQLLLKNADEHGVTDVRQVAYILGTCYWECKFRSIAEYRAKPEQKDIYEMQNRYWPSGYYGRGYPQLTWKKNYQKYKDEVEIKFGVNIVTDPDQVLRPEIGAYILVNGMVLGRFSGVALKHYFTDDPKKSLWIGARQIVNGNFKSKEVARVALVIYAVLKEFLK